MIAWVREVYLSIPAWGPKVKNNKILILIYSFLVNSLGCLIRRQLK